MSSLAAMIVVTAVLGGQRQTVDVDDVEPFTREELARIEQEANAAPASEDLNAQIERALCRNGHDFSAFSTPVNSRLHVRFSVAAGTRPARVPDVSVGAGAAWTLIDLNWTCHYPTREQLTDAGVPKGVIIDWLVWSPEYQLAVLVGADAFVGPASSLVMPHLALRTGRRLSDFGYPFVDVTFAAGPTFSAGGLFARPPALGAGLSLSVGIWIFELTGSLLMERDTQHYLVALSGRNRGALWQQRW